MKSVLVPFRRNHREAHRFSRHTAEFHVGRADPSEVHAMKTTTDRWWRILISAIVSTAVSFALHSTVAPEPEAVSLYPPSAFAEAGLAEAAAGMALLIDFLALSVFFVFIQGDLAGNKLSKGLRYGIAFAGLWFVGMFETNLTLGTSLADSVWMGAIDGVALMLLSVLLGLLVATDDGPVQGATGAIVIPTIAVAFLIGRYLVDVVFGIHAPYETAPLMTFAWRVGMGLWIGVMYRLLGTGVKREYSLIQHALWFGGALFGVNWLLFACFTPLIVDIPWTDVLTHGMDIVFVVAGIAIYQGMRQRVQSR